LKCDKPLAILHELPEIPMLLKQLAGGGDPRSMVKCARTEKEN